MEPQEREVDLIDYIEVILKRKWLILAGTLACVAGASAYLFFKVPVIPLYQASAQIFIVPSQAQLKETQVELPTLTPAFYQAVALADENILAMNQLQQILIDSLGLELPEAPLSLEAEVKDAVRMVMRVSAADTLLARRILYAWVDTFMIQNQGLNAAESSRYYHDIAAQYQRARQNLERVDSTLGALNAGSLVGAVRNEREQYEKRLIAAQDTLIATKFALEQREAKLKRLREMMQGLEQSGRPIYTLNAAEREGLHFSYLSPLAQQMLEYVTALDSLKKALGQAEGQYNLALLEFDREHDFAKLSREVEEVTKAIEGYQRRYLEASSQQMTASANLQALEEELKKHQPIVGDTGAGSGGTGSGKDIRELNPVYTELEQQQAKEGVAYETARVYAERGEKELWELQLRLEQAQRNFFEVQKKRLELEDRLKRERTSLLEQVKFFEDSFDAARRSYLDQKKELDSLALEVAAIRWQAKDQQDQLHKLEETVKKVQGSLTAELAQSERLDREKKNSTATVERFAQLFEEARTAQQKATTNLRLITRDVIARPAGTSDRSKKVAISAAVGLLVSTLLAFLLEYVHKARAQRSR